ncbi:2-oxoacid:acceptor oxidoreductase family protein [Candidatus Omnitrophota bacterium]
MREDIIFSGFGGQGIMLMGKALSYAAMKNGKFVTWLPSYGAEVRGGTAHSMVIISDEPVASPLVKEPSLCVVMNKPSLQKFEKRLKKHGLLIINKSMVESDSVRNDIDVLEVPATDMAFTLGDTRIANMIVLGALLAKKKILPLEVLADSLESIISKKRQDSIPINKEALRKGYEYGSR